MDKERRQDLKARILSLEEAGYDVSGLIWVKRWLLWLKWRLSVMLLLGGLAVTVACYYGFNALQRATYSEIQYLAAQRLYSQAINKFKDWRSSGIDANKVADLKKEIVNGALAQMENNFAQKKWQEATTLGTLVASFEPENTALQKAVLDLQDKVSAAQNQEEKLRREEIAKAKAEREVAEARAREAKRQAALTKKHEAAEREQDQENAAELGKISRNWTGIHVDEFLKGLWKGEEKIISLGDELERLRNFPIASDKEWKKFLQAEIDRSDWVEPKPLGIGMKIPKLLREATEASKSGKYQEVINACQKVLAIDPQNWRAFLMLANHYSGVGNHDKSLVYAAAALRCIRYNALFVIVADAYGKKGNKEKALLWLETGLKGGYAISHKVNRKDFDEQFSQYRNDSQYNALLKKYGIISTK